MKRFCTNVLEVFKILGLVLKARTKLRIVDKSMLMYNEHGGFIRLACAPGITPESYQPLTPTEIKHIEPFHKVYDTSGTKAPASLKDHF